MFGRIGKKPSPHQNENIREAMNTVYDLLSFVEKSGNKAFVRDKICN